MQITPNITRFRAYQLGAEGSSFSYFDGRSFTLIEGRLTETSEQSLQYELKMCGKRTIDSLHITSWDADHCNPKELLIILQKYSPSRVECPGYTPHTDTAKDSRSIIEAYKIATRRNGNEATLNYMTPEYTSTLEYATTFGYTNVLLHPHQTLYPNSNDNSTAMLFRGGSFTVLSLGDVEHPDIAKYIMNLQIVKNQTDVMILAHHGADNGFTSDKFLTEVKPKVAICSSNYDNKFEHPKPEIREILYSNAIPIFTTKTGDVIVRSIDPHAGKFMITNLICNNEEVSSHSLYDSRRILI
jgi:competence protein ComEC